LIPVSQQPRNIKGASTEGGTRSKTPLKMQYFFTPHLTFLGIIFLTGVFFIVLSHFLCSFQICKFEIFKIYRSTILGPPKLKKGLFQR
jgi:hypothetical protein